MLLYIASIKKSLINIQCHNESETTLRRNNWVIFRFWIELLSHKCMHVLQTKELYSLIPVYFGSCLFRTIHLLLRHKICGLELLDITAWPAAAAAAAAAALLEFIKPELDWLQVKCAFLASIARCICSAKQWLNYPGLTFYF